MHTFYFIILLLSVFAFALGFIFEFAKKKIDFLAFGLFFLALYFFLVVLNR